MTINDDEYQCGRCKTIKPNNTAMRNKIFEKVAQHLNFPCMNNSCTAVLPWKDVENHENDCVHTTIVCPIFHENCDEKITLKDLKNHILQKHGNNIFFDQIQLTLPMFKSFVCLAVVRSMEFLIYISSDKVLITSIKPADEKITYTLKLNSTLENHTSLVFDNQSIQLFNERKHCFRCLDKRCNLKYHPFSSVYAPVVEKKSVENGAVRKDKSNAQSRRRNPLNDINSPFYVPPRITGNTESIFGTPTQDNSVTITPPAQLKFSSIFSKNVSSGLGSAANDNNLAFYEPPTTTSSSNNTPQLFGNLTTLKTQNPSKPNDSNLQSTSNENHNDKDKPIKVAETEDQVKGLKCTTFNLAHVQNLIGMTPSIIFTITVPLTEECRPEPIDSYIPRNLLSTIDNTDVLRKILECPICNELMLDKIFVCERGHQICTKCKNSCNNRGTCPSCMGVLADNRSIALEALAEECSLCCSYKEDGCEFRGNPKNVSKHEKSCELREGE